jgi:hypothetical protein
LNFNIERPRKIGSKRIDRFLKIDLQKCSKNRPAKIDPEIDPEK